MDVDERRLAADAVVAIGHGEHDAFVQPHDQLQAGRIDEGVEEAGLIGAGIGEQVLDAGGLGLGHGEFAARAFERAAAGGSLQAGAALSAASAELRTARAAARLKPSAGHVFEKSAAREAAIKVAANEVLHEALRWC